MRQTSIIVGMIFFGTSLLYSLEPGLSLSPTKPDWYHGEVLDEAVSYLSQIENNGLSSNKDGTHSLQCINTYENLYKKHIVNFTIFFGYSDFSDGSVFDRYQRKVFAEYLLEPCVGNLFACGMKHIYSSERVDTLLKSITGPDGSLRWIIITLLDSSVSDFDSWNTNELVSDQREKSNSVQTYFENALNNSEVVFYKGHSRKGSGPGFSPLYKNNLYEYLKRRFKYPLKKMNKALKKPESSLKLFGYLGCLTDKYYSEPIKDSNSEIGFIVTDFKTKVAETNFIILASINALFSMKCEEDFLYDINYYKTIHPEIIKHGEDRITSLNNFFK